MSLSLADQATEQASRTMKPSHVHRGLALPGCTAACGAPLLGRPRLPGQPRCEECDVRAALDEELPCVRCDA